MSRSTAEKNYWNALERIKSGHTKVVNIKDPRFRISNITVALEAGKVNPKGYIRPQRYQELCNAIKIANDLRIASISKTTTKYSKSEVEKKKEIITKYKALRADYEKLLEQYLNVIKENFELKANNISDKK